MQNHVNEHHERAAQTHSTVSGHEWIDETGFELWSLDDVIEIPDGANVNATLDHEIVMPLDPGPFDSLID